MRPRSAQLLVIVGALVLTWGVYPNDPCLGQQVREATPPRASRQAEAPRVRRGPRPAGDRLALPPSVTHEANLEYARVGDRALVIDVLRPTDLPAGEKLPAIVFIHGGGWRNGDQAHNLPRLVYLAASGDYVCFSVDYRLTGEAPWPACMHDCKAAIRFIRANAERFHIDADRIGVMGSSAGGHLVAMLGTCQDPALEGTLGVTGVSSAVRCVASLCPPTDLVDWGAEPNEGATRSLSQLLGAPWGEAPEKAAEASPVNYVSPDDPPFLIVHSRNDGSVPYVQAEKLARKLTAAGVDVTLVPVESTLHGVTLVGVGRAPIDAFFAKHLRGEDVTVPAEPIVPRQREAQ